jgi:hypothetical protein
VPTCCIKPDCFPPNTGLHNKDIAVEKVLEMTITTNQQKTARDIGQRWWCDCCCMLPCNCLRSCCRLLFATNLALLLSLRWRLRCATSFLQFCCAGWLVPVVLPLLLVSLPCVPFLDDCCVHPLSCLFPPSSPVRPFVTIRPIANALSPPPNFLCLSSCPFVALAGCCLLRCLCCWHLCSHCACTIALLALELLLLLRWHLCHCYRHHCCCPLPPSNTPIKCCCHLPPPLSKVISLLTLL